MKKPPPLESELPADGGGGSMSRNNVVILFSRKILLVSVSGMD
jgi:hypothetical protein